ncbi:MerR family transcriptional regulator [Gracilibacillus sp. S3-1-1]|uniref:MerR family transcriptional regulator n=1 Tax=Gracilibacillus pellucidus TaxID=3095368 RepID=A0ACC6M5W0_9BACI|nr:MerR family transcriptional regulator [Gracilibacillus sp. S3-1-1]MDX8046263.1 MerR family transcriptional regulator [Gracilibacillus sp. S3-1-1]
MKYTISELSTLLNVSTNTIRRYEKMGYITPKRSKNNYRYYREADIAKFMNIRLLRKYGFTHTDIACMKNSDMLGFISAFEARTKEIDEQIDYLTGLSHRMKDDLVLMKKVARSSQQCYIRNSVAFSYVLYQSGEEILNEPERLATVQAYLYRSPEVQRIYIIRQEDVEKGQITLNAGWAIKMADLERFNMHDSAYTERYEEQTSVLSFAKLPVNLEKNKLSINLKETLLKEPFQYMKEHNWKLAGDIIGIVIANVVEENQDMQHILVSVPICKM